MTKERVIEELETIIDPHIGIDIWTLGLIYDISIKGDRAICITMTYTTPLCPFGAQLQQQITDGMRGLGFVSVEIVVSFDPPWVAPEALRDALGV